MRSCKAFVTTVKNDGFAEIVFQSDHPGIPGASDEINQKVCHCTPGPITIDAENGAGARPGDMVMVAWDKTARRKKTVILFGMPVMCCRLCLYLFSFDGVVGCFSYDRPVCRSVFFR